MWGILIIFCPLLSVILNLLTFQSFPNNPLDQIEQILTEVLHEWFLTFHMIFVPFANSTWLLGFVMFSDFLKFSNVFFSETRYIEIVHCRNDPHQKSKMAAITI